MSVEMALRAWMGQVYAIEKKEDALALLKENKKKFAVDNLDDHTGSGAGSHDRTACSDSCVYWRIFRKYEGDRKPSSGKKSEGTDRDQLYYPGNCEQKP